MSRSDSRGELPIGLVPGTRDWLPSDHERLTKLETALEEVVSAAGYTAMRTPILERAELHERKSGAGIVSKLLEVTDEHAGRSCLRPELTAGVVRAYVEASDTPALPWRVWMLGSVFRERQPASSRSDERREFTQLGVELIGAGGPAADAEIIALADRALGAVGLADRAIRVGHVGLVVEMLERSGLPPAVRSALLEILSEAAAGGRDVRAVETALDRLEEWLLRGGDLPISANAGPADDRLFRTLVPQVIGRRTEAEILDRLRRKWSLGRSLRDVLSRLRDQVHALAELRGPAGSVLERLRDDFRALAPASVEELLDLVSLLDDGGVHHDRVELDLGFARGLGFYTQMIFEVTVMESECAIEVCGGGRYDGLARVLGSDRDDRGVGFAIDLERLGRIIDGRTPSTAGTQTSGCRVVASQAAQSAGQALVALLRSQNQGRWDDGGPIVGPDVMQDFRGGLDRQLDEAALAVVSGELTEPGGVKWYSRVGAVWREEPQPPAILLARGGEARS